MDNTPVIETERLRLRRFTERDAEALRQLGQGDVHHALAERGRERARQQHGQHARHASASLLRVAHPTALPRTSSPAVTTTRSASKQMISPSDISTSAMTTATTWDTV